MLLGRQHQQLFSRMTVKDALCLVRYLTKCMSERYWTDM